MGERKVLNKYYPPDFDATKIPRRKRDKNEQHCVRMMLPMSIRCEICGEYMYKGKKFNSRKEMVEAENYLGIMVFRFYMKCLACCSEFCIKTDPKNMDYIVEAGASRNFEPWRAADDQKEAVLDKREEEEHGDAMKALENRTKDSKMEMDILDALDEVRTMNSRNNKVNVAELIQINREKEAARQAATEAKKNQLDDEEEAMVAAAFGSAGAGLKRLSDDSGSPVLKKAKSGDKASKESGKAKATAAETDAAASSTTGASGGEGVKAEGKAEAGGSGDATTTTTTSTATKPPPPKKKSLLPVGMVVQAKTAAAPPKEPPKPDPPAEEATEGSGLSLLGSYGSTSGSGSDSP